MFAPTSSNCAYELFGAKVQGPDDSRLLSKMSELFIPVKIICNYFGLSGWEG